MVAPVANGLSFPSLGMRPWDALATHLQHRSVAGDAATETPHDPGVRTSKNSRGREAIYSEVSGGGLMGGGPEPPPCTRQCWGDELPGATASSLQHCIGHGRGEINHVFTFI